MRLLVFNCHEAWVHQLGWLDGCSLEIVVGLKGRSVSGWDTRMRPLPVGARLVTLREAESPPHSGYDAIICHNITDLMDAKAVPGLRIFVIHGTLEGKLAEDPFAGDPLVLKGALRRYLEMLGGRAVAVSRLKCRSWGFDPDRTPILPFAVDPSAYLPWDGSFDAGLRISNIVHRRKRILRWDFFEETFSGIPMTVVGVNPEMPGVSPSRDWGDLKTTLSHHRFYVHTADPQMEDGYNMATIEAMAAGLPVVGNLHPTSPVEHGVSGFLSDDPAELRGYALRLLADRELAGRMGRKAREAAGRLFSIEAFRTRFLEAVGDGGEHP